ncbi:hypothetical protein [Spongiibacter tropicus]|uniref:hypothetical protein n=1 Tax=Spongiibacter tropicus TaxID=454602 RepID=UPI0035BE2D23
MAYNNQKNRERLLNIQVAKELFASVSVLKTVAGLREQLEGTDEYFYLRPEIGHDRNVFNMPFLLDADGFPWDEANNYLYSIVANKHSIQRPTDQAHRIASRLLDYKFFTEDEGIDYLDFSGKRITARPTYRYFYYLAAVRALSPRVVNQYTGDIWDFYQFIANSGQHNIDLGRVDKVTNIRMAFSGHTGPIVKDVLKRSQTLPVPGKKPTLLGYVDDEGEKLRPLTTEQISELKRIINSRSWSASERLMITTSLMTGARKQTVLTLRLKHVRLLFESKIEGEGLFKLHVGPGTLVDTKKSKPQILYFPRQLIEELWTYANSEEARARRKKFKEKFSREFPSLKSMDDDDIYIFLSDQGNCYYMGFDDPRYPRLKRSPAGQVTDQLKRKIFRTASDRFPRDFYYHWLRATYAYLLWLGLQKHINSGELSDSAAISFIQARLYHKSRETTENYLKLFSNLEIQMVAQESFEDFLLPDEIFEEKTELEQGVK